MSGVGEEEARWGCRNRKDRNCDPYNCHLTVLINAKTKQIFPNGADISGHDFYNFPGFSIDDDLLIIKRTNWPIKVDDGEEFIVYSLHPKHGNKGIHCIRVDASFLE